jgi:hypothetical protein
MMRAAQRFMTGMPRQEVELRGRGRTMGHEDGEEKA